MFQPFRPLRSLAILAALALSSAITDTIAMCVGAARATRDWLVANVLAAASMTQPKAGAIALKPERMLISAAASLARIVQRPRIALTTSWRMCPSI